MAQLKGAPEKKRVAGGRVTQPPIQRHGSGSGKAMTKKPTSVDSSSGDSDDERASPRRTRSSAPLAAVESPVSPDDNGGRLDEQLEHHMRIVREMLWAVEGCFKIPGQSATRPSSQAGGKGKAPASGHGTANNMRHNFDAVRVTRKYDGSSSGSEGDGDDGDASNASDRNSDVGSDISPLSHAKKSQQRARTAIPISGSGRGRGLKGKRGADPTVKKALRWVPGDGSGGAKSKSGAGGQKGEEKIKKRGRPPANKAAVIDSTSGNSDGGSSESDMPRKLPRRDQEYTRRGGKSEKGERDERPATRHEDEELVVIGVEEKDTKDTNGDDKSEGTGSNASAEDDAASAVDAATAKSAAGGTGRGALGGPFRFSSFAKENHKHVIYGVRFNPHHNTRQGTNILATVGGNRCTVYECNGDGSLVVLQSYMDEDQEEELYTCAWSYEPKHGGGSAPILAVAGLRGIIKIIRTDTRSVAKVLVGHGHAVNDLRFHPLLPHILLSASQDVSLRLWNVRTGVPVAIFGGDGGHRDQILHTDFNLDATRIVSCGMDVSIKIWAADTPEIARAIEQSDAYDPKSPKSYGETIVVHYPIFSTLSVHENYIDCVAWLGNLILSKSVREKNHVTLWMPDDGPRKTVAKDKAAYTGDPVIELHQFEIKDCNVWYVRFCIDALQRTLAVGNTKGVVFVYPLDVPRLSQSQAQVLSHPKCRSTVRQVAISADGQCLAYVCDDATVWRFDRSKK